MAGPGNSTDPGKETGNTSPGDRESARTAGQDIGRFPRGDKSAAFDRAIVARIGLPDRSKMNK